MLFPTGTDAPIYHFPAATIGLIAANFVCFCITGFGYNQGAIDPWILHYGNGLNPAEWISSSFAHAGFSHLLGNMLFLWCFGLVVEGKVGWKIFLPIYFGIVVFSGAVTDVVTLLHSHGGCLGASDAIFGLMAISLIWAPKNEVHFEAMFMGYGYGLGMPRAFSFDVTILTLSLWYLGTNLLSLLLWPGMSTSFLHLLGSLAGFPIGIVMLKKGLVDCENWDLFAVMKGTHGRFGEKDWALGYHSSVGKTYDTPIPLPINDAAADAKTRRKVDRSARRAALSEINRMIDEGDVLTAADDLFRLRIDDPAICIGQEKTQQLAKGLLKAEAFDEAEFWLQELIDRFPNDSAWARVRMAQLLLMLRQQPRAAIETLEHPDAADLPVSLKPLAAKILSTARAQIRNGVVDAELSW
jgi:membrane associated rhomboid family serine protease